MGYENDALKLGRNVNYISLNSANNKVYIEMPTRDSSSQWEISPHHASKHPSEELEETNDRFENFWSNLPKSQQLREKGIGRLHRKKSDVFLNKALSVIVAASLQAEQKDKDLEQQAAKIEQRRSALLDRSRYSNPKFFKPAISEGLEKFLTSAPHSWSSEWKLLENDLQSKAVQRTQSWKPKVLQSLGQIKIANSESDFKNRMLLRVNKIRQESLRRKISAERRKEIRAEIFDINLMNRPTHFLQPPSISHLDPIEGTQSVDLMCENVMQQLSEETKDYLKSQIPEPKLSPSTENIYRRRKTSKYEIAQYVPSPRISKKRFSFIQPNRKECLNNPISLNGDDEEVSCVSDNETFNIEDGLESFADSGFGFNCLKDLVNFQEESGWGSEENLFN